MEFRYAPPQYHKDTGLRREWERGFKIDVRIVGNEVTIRANPAGLISLAKHLLTLAGAEVPNRCHYHYDSGSALEDESADLIIARLAEDASA